jgi:lipopolysaccharide transport system ATP-binding protein
MTPVQFHQVFKSYPKYQFLLKGLKSSLLRLPETLRSFQQERTMALQDVSFEIQRGETVGLIGLNGAGKSTTLGLMAGILQAESGQIIVRGRVSPLLELGAGFHPDLTGFENITLHGVLLGLRRQEVVSRMDEIIEFSELAGVIDRPLRTYSTGMVARLGFSIAVHLDPEILLIDEILSVGDLPFQLKCNAKIDEFRQRHITMVIVSHSMDHIQRLCDRVIWLEKGRMLADGLPRTILPQYVKAAHGSEADKQCPLHNQFINTSSYPSERIL